MSNSESIEHCALRESCAGLACVVAVWVGRSNTWGRMHGEGTAGQDRAWQKVVHYRVASSSYVYRHAHNKARPLLTKWCADTGDHKPY
eukprot:COSAG06_NODE_1472_length_9346_cov_5.895750_6_plen_88_part_00